jgi:hypothetical protein
MVQQKVNGNYPADGTVTYRDRCGYYLGMLRSIRVKSSSQSP